MKHYFTLLLIFFGATSILLGQEKPRIIVETDIGGDPDDQATLVRFLLYANEFDIEGIILTLKKSTYLSNNPNVPSSANDPYKLTNRYLDGYGQVVNNLNAHAPSGRKFPSTNSLKSITKWNYDVYDRPSNAGVDLIINELKKNDTRPIWFINWGAYEPTDPTKSSVLRRALDLIEQGNQGITYQNAVNKIKFVEYENLNGLGSLIGNHLSKVSYVMDTFLPGCGDNRWAKHWEPLTSIQGWIKNTSNVDNRLSRDYTIGKEGDTMTWMHLIDNGINIIGWPEWGGWSGRYTNLSNSKTNNDCPSFPNSSNNRFWKSYESDISPTNGTINRDHTLTRWGTSSNESTDIKNDFKARWKWTISSTITSANHAPIPKVTAKDLPISYEDEITSSGTTPIFEFAFTGIDIRLDASASSDPDGNRLIYQWVLYKEITTPGLKTTVITNPNSARTTIKIPNVNIEGYVHLYLRVTDVPGSGKIPITRYQRVIFKTLGLPYAPPAMKLVNQVNQVLPSNLILNRQSNSSYQVKVQVTPVSSPISKIELYSNNIKIAEDTTAPYIFNFSKSQPGTYNIKARLWYNNNSYSVYSNQSTIKVKDVIIASIQPNSSKSYQAMENFGKIQCFTDRPYKLSIYPSFLNSAEYIMTPDADKYSTTANLLTININETADVYVAYDRKLPRLPVWLRSYTDTREHVRTGGGAIFRLYKKRFVAGTAVLGGNESRQTDSSNYFVIVKKLNVLRPTNFQKALYNTNENTTIYPSNLTNGENIKTPNDYESAANNNLLVYPNPAKESITISRTTKQPAKVIITDTQGIILIQTEISMKDLKVDVSNLREGVYILILETKYGIEKTLITIGN